MDGLSIRIRRGLPGNWNPTPLNHLLPEYTSVALCASNGSRRLAFLRVQSHIRSAMPFFDANSQLRKSGVEVVWLFDHEPIPSTKQMICAALEWRGSMPLASIVNAGQPGCNSLNQIEMGTLSKAAAEQRLRLFEIEAGQCVFVSVTPERATCTHCGTATYRVLEASFQLADSPEAPALVLKGDDLGPCISRQIVERLRGRFPGRSPRRIGGLAGACPMCHREHHGAAQPLQHEVTSIGCITLSSLAVLELLRHHKTAWYIA